MKLEDALLEQKQQSEPYNQSLYGRLGIPLGGELRVEVPERNSFVYVRLRSNQSEVIQAFNNKVAIAYNLPVVLKREGGRYVVTGVDTQSYENNWNSFAPFLPRHGNTHSFDLESGGGGDIVWVYPRQFTPALVMPSGSLGAGSVIVNSYTLRKENGAWLYAGNTGTPSLLPYRPTSATGAIIALVYLDSQTGNPGLLINSGTVFSNSITGSNQIPPFIPVITGTSQIPLAAIRLVTGTSAISWDNIYDLRQFIHPLATGTGGGGGLSSISVQDEAVNQGNVTTFNFVGTNIQASVSGSIARVSPVMFSDAEGYPADIGTRAFGTSQYAARRDHVHTVLGGLSLLASTINLTGTAGAYQDTGLSVTLSDAGLYKLTADVRGELQGNTGAVWWISVKLYDSIAAADVPNSERLVVLTNSNAAYFQMTCPINVRYSTGGGGAIIKLYAKRDGTSSPTWSTSNIVSGALGNHGQTVLMYERLA